MYRLHHQGDKNRRARNNVSNVESYTRRHIPQDDIVHSHRRENLNSYTVRLVSRNTEILFPTQFLLH
jgi:hypothetical protein